jgi:hypothetical protein
MAVKLKDRKKMIGTNKMDGKNAALKNHAGPWTMKTKKLIQYLQLSAIAADAVIRTIQAFQRSSELSFRTRLQQWNFLSGWEKPNAFIDDQLTSRQYQQCRRIIA